MTEKELVAKMLETLVKSRKELANIDLGVTQKALPDLEKIIEHISAPLMIMVMGEFSTGKSTFINALVGEEIAAVNATPTTAVITKLCYGEQDKILVHFTDGTEKEFKSDSFKQLTAKNEKEDGEITHDNIEYVERQLPLNMLQYVTVVDSPGLNDINEKHSATTKKFVNNADTVFWMFNALHACSKTEVDAMEALTPRLKPIAIINLMDKIDEEEDDPQEFLDNLRVQLKDKVQAVVGISAKYALEGKLEKNETKIEIGNLKELEQVVQDLVLPNRNKFKLNTLMDELGEWVYNHIGKLKELKESNKNEKENNYISYLNKKANIQQNEEVLFNIASVIQRYCLSESKKFNEQAMYLTGVLQYHGVCLEKDENLAENYWEDAALKNHTLSQKALGNLYISKNEAEKAFVWYLKVAEQDDADYQYYVGQFYQTGWGVEKNEEKAHFWFKKAAELGNKDAKTKVRTEKSLIDNEEKPVQKNKFTIVVIGEFSTGKSTFVNALLGKRIMPSGVIPTTNVITKIIYGEETAYTIHYRDGKVKSISEEEFLRIKEKNYLDFNTCSKIQYIEVKYPASFCKDNVEVIDTPGMGNISIESLESNNEVKNDYIKRADVVILLESAIMIRLKKIKEFLRERYQFDEIQKYFIVVNKIDEIDPEEDDVDDFKDYVKQNALEELSDIGDFDKRIFFVSSEKALKYRQIKTWNPIRNLTLQMIIEQTGFPNLEREIMHFINSKRS